MVKTNFLKRSLSLILVISTLLGAFSFSSFAAERQTASVIPGIEDVDDIIDTDDPGSVDGTNTESDDSEVDGIAVAPAPIKEIYYSDDAFESPSGYALATANNISWSEVKQNIRNSMRSFSESIDVESLNIYLNDVNFVKLWDVIHDEIPEPVHSWSYIYSTSNNQLLSVRPKYSVGTASEYNAMLAELDSATNRILSGIKGNSALNDVQKALLIHDKLAEASEYDTVDLEFDEAGMSHPEIRTTYGILVNGMGICAAYARAYNYLLDEVGIESTYCSSETLRHAWNIVIINGNRYYVDVTWDDNLYSGNISHTYFLCSYSAFGHSATDYDTSCRTTTYDNAFWKDIYAAFQLVGNEIYYIDPYAETINKYSNNASVKDISSTWIWDESGTTYGGYLGCLASDGSVLYYSTCDKIYKYNPSSGATSVFLTPDLSMGSNFYIYGFTYVRGIFVYEVFNSPYFKYEYRTTYQYKYGTNVFGKNFSWKINNNVLTIYGTGRMPDYTASSVMPWNSYKNTITSVAIKGCITYIGQYTFAGLTNCKYIDVCDSVASVGKNAFGNATVLCRRGSDTHTRAWYGNYNYGAQCQPYVGYYNHGLYYDYSNNSLSIFGFGSVQDLTITDNTPWKDYMSDISLIVIKSGVSSIGDKAFENYSDLERVSFSADITKIGTAAFYKCSSLTSVTMSNTVKTLGDRIFNACSALKSVTLSNALTDIPANAFAGCSSLTSIAIPNSVKTIQTTAFGNCTSLKSVTLSNTLTEISANAFSGCSSLTSITMPNSVKTLGNNAFKNCTTLKSVTLSGSVKQIPQYAFSGCTALESLTIPNGVTSIGMCAFENCSALENLKISSNVTSIGQSAFYGCSGLVDVTIPDGVTVIPATSFGNCINLESVVIPDSVTTIYKNSFANCSKLTIVCSPFSYAAEYAKENGIKSKHPGYLAIGTCGDELGWYITDDGTLYINGSGNMYDYEDPEIDEEIAPWLGYSEDITSVVIGGEVRYIGAYAFSGLYNATSATICSSVDTIGEAAFSAMSGLAEIVIPEGVSVIENYAFSGCDSLVSVKFPSTLKQIGAFAFQGCGDLTSVDTTDAKNLTTIGTRAFSVCNSLSEITLPGSVTSIGDAIFFKETYYSATKVTCPAGSKIAELIENGWQCGTLVLGPAENLPSGSCGDDLTWVLSDNGTLYIYGSGEMYNYGDLETDGVEAAAPWFAIPDYDNKIKAIVIGDDVTGIGEYAFGLMSNVTKVTIGDSVKTIGAHAFSDSDALVEIVIPEGVTTIGKFAFCNCPLLTSVTLPSTLEQIASKAFYATGLKEIIIPGKTSTIAADAFDGVTKASGSYETLTWVLENGVLTVSGDAKEYNFTKAKPAPWATAAFKDRFSKLVVEEGTEILGNYAFRNCTALETIVFPESLKEINWYTFALCTSLKEVVLPDGVTNIGLGAFKECTALENVELSESLAAVSSDAFNGCTSLKTIKIPASVVFFSNTADDYFGGCDLDQLTIICKPDSPAESFAVNNNIKYEYYDVEVEDDTPVLSVDEYTVSITNGDKFSYVRYALGEYTTGGEVKNAPGCVTLSAAKIATYLDDEGNFVYEMPNGGFYTFWVKLAGGEEFILYADVTNIRPYVTVDGIRVTFHNLYGIRDITIARGTLENFQDVKNHRVVQISKSRFEGMKSYTYTLSNEDCYTVCFRFDDDSRAYQFEHITIDVLNPTYIVNGLQVTVGNLEGVKLIRTAYGEYNSVSEMKQAAGNRTFTQSVIKGADEYTVQYRESGVVTVAVQYTNGYTEFIQLEVTQKESTMVQKGNTVTFGNLEGLQVLRYAEGEYETAAEIKRAVGSRAVKADKIDENGNIEITLAAGTYTFYLQYFDGSNNFHTVTIK